MKQKPRLLVFNSGSGSGFQKLVENSWTGVLDAEIVGLVSNSQKFNCLRLARLFNIKHDVMQSFGAEDYQALVNKYNADYVLLSGWLKFAKGLDPRTTINIHPGPLPKFGGPGMYGHYVHEAMISAAQRGEASHSDVTMHFVTEGAYDDGPVFFRYPVFIHPFYDADRLGAEVNKIEHGWQSYVTNFVVHGQIYWDGKDPHSLVVPDCIKNFL